MKEDINFSTHNEFLQKIKTGSKISDMIARLMNYFFWKLNYIESLNQENNIEIFQTGDEQI